MNKTQHHDPSPQPPDFAAGLFAWPAFVAAAAGRAIALSLDPFVRGTPTTAAAHTGSPLWASPHRLRLELGTMDLRDFSTGQSGVPALICAPLALHRATIADFAPGHSVVEALCNGGLGRVHVADWRSATAEMRYLSIDNYLADLNVAVDDLEPPVDLVGICQGGWLALAYAARFPYKVRRFVLAGAPIDVAAGESMISQGAARFPLAALETLVSSEGGRVRGERVLRLWGPALSVNDERDVLQIAPGDHSVSAKHLLAHFNDWYEMTVDLPGTYYLQVTSWLFQENRLAEGNFIALGRRIDLSTVHHPIFMLAGRDDNLVNPAQLFATADRVRTPKQHIETATEPCGHLSLFLGADTIKRRWTRIAQWLGEELSAAHSVSVKRAPQR
jgi:poly(3-hydroxyalkanoate) synthetase